jgi:hypothetical protein
MGKIKVSSGDFSSFSLVEMVFKAKELVKRDLEHYSTAER